MNFKGIYYSLTFRLALAIGLTAALTYQALEKEWGWFLFLGIGWLAALRGISLLFKRNAQKVAFMFDAIDNSDYAFKYATRGRSSNDKLVSDSLNRITQILFQAKAEAIQKEKYYELIMNQVNTGIIIRKTKCFDFWERNVLFPKTKRSFFRTPTPLPCPFPLNFSLLIITKKFGNLAKNRYICIV